MQAVHAKSRDNARTPMHWDDSAQGRFTTGTPWLPVNPNYTEINAASQVNDKDSVFSYYKQLIRLRKEIPVIVDALSACSSLTMRKSSLTTEKMTNRH